MTLHIVYSKEDAAKIIESTSHTDCVIAFYELESNILEYQVYVEDRKEAFKPHGKSRGWMVFPATGDKTHVKQKLYKFNLLGTDKTVNDYK